VDLERLEQLLTGDAAFLRLAIRISRRRWGDGYVAEANRLLGFLVALVERLSLAEEEALGRYVAFVRRRIEETRSFQETGRYRYQTAAQAQAALDRKTEEDLLLALVFSYVLAPHRYALLRAAADYAAEYVAAGDRCLHLGVGCGMETDLLDRRRALVEAYDPGEHSGLCLELLGVSDRVMYRQQEYQFTEERRFQHVVLVELLEHVDDPLSYLEGVHRVLEPGGTCLATFALRMPQPDHVYLFDSVSAARRLVRAAGLETLAESYLIASFMESPPERVEALAESSRYAANYVCVLRKPPDQ